MIVRDNDLPNWYSITFNRWSKIKGSKLNHPFRSLSMLGHYQASQPKHNTQDLQVVL